LLVTPAIGHQWPQPGRIHKRQELRRQVALVKHSARGGMLNRVAAHIRRGKYNLVTHPPAPRQPQQLLRDPRLHRHGLISLEPTHHEIPSRPGAPTRIGFCRNIAAH
jgi:hypothetical protein